MIAIWPSPLGSGRAAFGIGTPFSPWLGAHEAVSETRYRGVLAVARYAGTVQRRTATTKPPWRTAAANPWTRPADCGSRAGFAPIGRLNGLVGEYIRRSGA